MTSARTARWTVALLLVALAGLATACSRDGRFDPTSTPTQSGGVPVPERKPAPPPQLAGKLVPSVAQSPGAPVTYRVRRGDTLYGVARTFGVPIRTLIRANALVPPYRLEAGDTLTVPRPRVHQVEAGETIVGISRAYGVDASELVRLNALRAPYTIAVGEKLVLPGESAPQPRIQEAAVEALSLDTPSPPPQPERVEVPETGTPAPQDADDVTTRSETTAPTSSPDEAAALIQEPPPRAGGKFLWPVEGQLIGGYGPREGGMHNDGINVAAPRGTPVRAAENGVIAYVGSELRGFGNLVLIKHADGWVSAYAHNEALLVKRGDQVKRGQVIARVGSSGSVSRPQLHFEIRKGTRAIDPMRLLAQQRT